MLCVAVESFAESLFWHLGITSPQYFHIIEMYEDMKEEVSVIHVRTVHQICTKLVSQALQHVFRGHISKLILLNIHHTYTPETIGL